MVARKYYTVEVFDGNNVEIVAMARNLKSARAEAYAYLKAHPTPWSGINAPFYRAYIYLGNDYKNGVDGYGEKTAYVTRIYKSFVYVVAVENTEYGYLLSSDGSLGSRIFVRDADNY